ncbi:MAG: 30S ribosomal protein S3 [Chloroflexota bacterium]
MGHKVHPYAFRLGVTKGWHSLWYNKKGYGECVQEDLKIFRFFSRECVDCAIARAEIDRRGRDISVTLYSSRPGVVIGRGGQRVEEIRSALERQSGQRVKLTVREVQYAELEAALVARNVADQIERRIAFRRAMRQTVFRTMQAGAKGVKIMCAGRLGNAEIARRETTHQGQLPLHTLRADIDYGTAEAHTLLGRIGVKVWIYKGEILPEVKEKTSATAETSKVS